MVSSFTFAFVSVLNFIGYVEEKRSRLLPSWCCQCAVASQNILTVLLRKLSHDDNDQTPCRIRSENIHYVWILFITRRKEKKLVGG